MLMKWNPLYHVRRVDGCLCLCACAHLSPLSFFVVVLFSLSDISRVPADRHHGLLGR